MIIRLLIVALAAVVGSAASAATFNVNNPTEFQNALTTAQSNDDHDVINVAAGTYDVSTAGTLTYTADPTEAFGLSIFGADSTLVILDGGAQVPILRIDTTAVSLGESINLDVTNMTFRNGYATGTNGGALAIEVIEVVYANIAGSEFYNNRADGDGGAIYVDGLFMEGLNFDDLTIQGNEAFGTADGRRGDGGGVAVRAAWPTYTFVNNIDFFSNQAAGFGGGLEVEGVNDATGSQYVGLYDVMFEDNLVTGSGSGGGASLFALDVFVELVGFINNTAPDIGGGLHLREHSANRTVNCGFVDNTARLGGGFGTDTWNGSGVVLEHNTFTTNTATELGGGIYISRGLPNRQISLYNNIVWGNSASGGMDIYVNDDPDDVGGDQVTEVELVNNIFSDFTTKCAEAAGCTERVIDTDNINANPMITADLHLLPGSPAIDAGLNTGHPMYPVVTYDFDFDTRPFDGDGDSVATTDIGIDEYVGGVVQGADLAVTKTDSPDPVVAGNNITYTVTVTNNGPGDATNVSLIDQLDADTTFVSIDPQDNCTHGVGLINCNFATIANGASVVITIVVQVSDQIVAQRTVGNTVDVNAAEDDPDGTDNTAHEQTTVVPPTPNTVDLAITKIDTPDPVVSGGGQLTYTITVTNNGPDAATGVVVTDVVPMGLTIDGATTGVEDCAVNGMQVGCLIGGLAVDAEETVIINVSPEPVEVSTDFDNTATVSGNEEDPVAGNNSATATTTVTPPESDMMVSVVATPASPSVGETVTYGITITNDGPSHNTGVNLSITLPTMGTFQDVSVSQGDCSAPVKGVISCTIGDMLSGAVVTAEVVFTAPDEAASMALSASVTGSVADPTGDNNSHGDAASVIAAVDLVIQGKSKGGAFGWLELLLLALAVAAFRTLRTARYAAPCLLVAAMALVLVPASDAQAQGQWYVQGVVGKLDLDYSASDLTNDLSNLGWTITSPVVDSDDTAWKLVGGYTFNEYVAFEAGYVSLGEVTTQFSATVEPGEIDNILADTYTVHPYQGDGLVAAAVLSWPIDPGRFSVNLKAGFFAWKSETDVRVIQGGTGSVSGEDDGTSGMYGLGIEWKLNPTWALTADWERYKMNQWLDVPLIGVKVYF